MRLNLGFMRRGGRPASFGAAYGVALSTATTSRKAYPRGISSGAAITASAGAEYSLDGGAWTSDAGVWGTTKQIRARITSSADYETTVTATITIGGVAYAFPVTTVAVGEIPSHIKLLWRAGDTLKTLKGPSHATSYTGAFKMPDGSTKTVPVDATNGLWVGPGYGNLLVNSVFAGAVSGTPGIAPTSWGFAVAGGSTVATLPTIKFTCAIGARHFIQQQVSVSASTIYRLTANTLVVVGDQIQTLCQFNAAPSGSTVTYELDGVSVAATTVVTAGVHVLASILTVSTTPGTVQARVGAGCNAVSVNAIDISVDSPQVSQAIYKMPYIPTTGSAITNPSAVGTSGGNGASWPLTGSDSAERLIECLRGKPDGVELWSDASASGTNWALSSGVWTHTAGSTAVLAIAGLLTLAARYKVIWTMSNRTAGSVTSRAGSSGTGGSAQTANGTYTTELTCAGSTDMQFVPSSDFDGKVAVVSVQKLNPATFTIGALCYMGAESAELPAANYAVLDSNNTGLLLNHSHTAIAKTYDGVNNPVITGSWSRGEYHLKLVQSKADGSQYRVGNKRIGIDSAIQWGSWSNFDGSFNPLTDLRLAYNGTTPLHIKGGFASDESLSDAEIEHQYNIIIGATGVWADLSIWDDTSIWID